MKSNTVNIWCVCLVAAAIWVMGTVPVWGLTFQINDPVEFNKIISTNAVLTTNATLNSWIEGPVWVPSDGGYLIFSDIGNNRLKKLTPPFSLTDYWVPPANTKCNGNMLDLQERLISCQAGSAALQVAMRTNGVVTPLVTHYNSTNNFYSPNDLTMKSDGTIWFTDPGYDSGVGSPPLPGFQPSYAVYRFYETNGNASVLQVTDSLIRPNGICLSPDETKLYVADTGGSNPKTIKVFDVTTSNTVTGGSTFVTGNTFDGIKCDVDGRIWAGDATGVAIYAPDGHLIGKIIFKRVANLCFGGPQYKTLYMVGQPYITSIPVSVPGLLAAKKLNLSSDGSQLNISWPAPSTGYALEEAEQLGAETNWTEAVEPPVVVNGSNTVAVLGTNNAMFYRLKLN